MPNVVRGFEVEFKNMVRTVKVSDENTKKEFEEDVERVRAFLNDYRETRRALVIFCDASEDFFGVRELAVRVIPF
jgi:hypothetical protein